MKKINVTQPNLPELAKFCKLLQKIWDSKWLTNDGQYHQRFEFELTRYLKVKHCSLISNGTLALMIALKTLDIRGEIITTPFSFVATTHALNWNGVEPVFCDIESHNLNIDPNKIEALITDKTTAIMPVHVYGHPCDHKRIKEIADKYNLKVIYDAAHAFGVEEGGKSILNYGDLSILSFHATKVFNTVEGGAIITKDATLKDKIDKIKNFGFIDEETIDGIGINAKMNELIAAYGLLQLDIVDGEIDSRSRVAEYYKKELLDIPGIKTFNVAQNTKSNFAYFPILVNSEVFGYTRDELYDYLKSNGINTRKYFYPLISQFEPYRKIKTASKANLPIATKIASEVLCLPMYGKLLPEEMIQVISLIKNIRNN